MTHSVRCPGGSSGSGFSPSTAPQGWHARPRTRGGATVGQAHSRKGGHGLCVKRTGRESNRVCMPDTRPALSQVQVHSSGPQCYHLPPKPWPLVPAHPSRAVNCCIVKVDHTLNAHPSVSLECALPVSRLARRACASASSCWMASRGRASPQGLGERERPVGLWLGDAVTLKRTASKSQLTEDECSKDSSRAVILGPDYSVPSGSR